MAVLLQVSKHQFTARRRNVELSILRNIEEHNAGRAQ